MNMRTDGKIRCLALCSYPETSAATRYRLCQFMRPLAERNIDVTISPFLNEARYRNFYKKGRAIQNATGLIGPVLRRFFESVSTGTYDLLFVQREAMMFGPPLFEWLAHFVGRLPMVLDLDDATYVPYISPTYGKMGSALKFFGKTDQMIAWSDHVIACNRFVAEYVEKKGTPATEVPTVVDTDKFSPATVESPDLPTIGWIGTHSTYPFLESLFPVLERLALDHKFKLKVVGAGDVTPKIRGVLLENLPWSLGREIDDFRSLDIGLYPMVIGGSTNRDWLFGKACFKAVQYMAVGIPFVLTPIGNCADIGIADVTHIRANSDDEWFLALKRLLDSAELRSEMGARGRQFALEHFTISQQVDKIASVFESVVAASR